MIGSKSEFKASLCGNKAFAFLSRALQIWSDCSGPVQCTFCSSKMSSQSWNPCSKFPCCNVCNVKCCLSLKIFYWSMPEHCCHTFNLHLHCHCVCIRESYLLRWCSCVKMFLLVPCCIDWKLWNDVHKSIPFLPENPISFISVLADFIYSKILPFHFLATRFRYLPFPPFFLQTWRHNVMEDT